MADRPDPVAEAMAALEEKLRQANILRVDGPMVINVEPYHIRTLLSALERRTKALEEARGVIEGCVALLRRIHDQLPNPPEYETLKLSINNQVREALAALSGTPDAEV